MRRIGVFVFTVCVPLSASAYPISPVPLWDLVAKADQIVLATVDGVTPPPSTEGEGDEELPTRERWESVAHLSVLETWHGNEMDWIDVRFPAGMICPAPPVYAKGRTVLAFLELEKDGQFSTVGLSYGTFYPDEEGIDALREVVAQARELHANGLFETEDRRGWLVFAATRRATRWSALYELVPESDEVHYFYDTKARSPRLPVTHQEMAAIADGFVRAPSLDQTFLMTLGLLGTQDHDAFDATAVAVFDAVMSSQPIPRWAKNALPLLFSRFELDAPATSAVVTSPEHPDRWSVHPHALDADLLDIWLEARKRIRIRAVPVLELERPPMPVGGNTPD
jgi:hypothetical protein